MSKMFIRVKTDGFIYPYNEIMAGNPLCEVVPEEIAYPERFVPPKSAKRKGTLDLSTVEVSEPLYRTNPALATEAAKGMPK